MDRLINDTDVLAMIQAIGVNLTATYTPSGGVAVPVYIVFNNESEEAAAFNEAVITSGPMALGRASDFTGIVAPGGTLLIDGTTYNITAAKPDGEGFIEMLLSEDIG